MTSPTLSRRYGVTGNKAIKAPVRAATSGNITLSGLQTTGGVSLIADDRCLVWQQTTVSQNGIYDVSSGAWTRSVDANGSQDLAQSTVVVVSEGTYALQAFGITTSGDIVPGTTNIVWAQTIPFLTSLVGSGGSAIVGFIQDGSGADLRTVQSKLRDVFHVADFGAIGGGNSTDTVDINEAFVAASGSALFFDDVTYSGLGRLYPKDDTTIYFSGATVLQSATSVFGTNERFINIDDVSNIVWHGNHGVVKMNNEYANGEQRHNVFMVDAHNISIYDLHSDDSGGDGFYIGRNAAGTHCTNIMIHNCFADGNRRQGGSMVSGSSVTVIGGVYSGTDGTSPQYGWDIEPNDSDDVCENITFMGVVARDNSGGGFLIALKNFVTTASRKCSISLIGCKSIGDCVDGTSGSASLRISGDGAAWVNTLTGDIIVTDFQSLDCNRSAVFIQDWDYVKGCHILINGGRATNPNANNTAAQPYDQCGLAVYTSGTTAGVGNFTVKNFEISGANLYTGAYMADSLGAIRNFTLHDVICRSASTTSGSLHYVSAAGPNAYSSITYTNQPTVTLSASGEIKNYPGVLIKIGAAGVYDIPLGSDCIGQKFYIVNGGAYTTEINPNNADLLDGWGYAAGDAIVMNKEGDMVTIASTETGLVVESISWYAQRVGGYTETLPSKIRWVTGVPVAGARKFGDLNLNVTGAVGGIWAWTTSTEGSPGTQSPVGIIGAVQCAAHADSAAATLADFLVEWNSFLAKQRTSKLIAT